MGDCTLFCDLCARRTNYSRDSYRCRPHIGIDRGQCVLRAQGPSHFFHIDPGSGHFDGDPAEFPRCDRSGKQHRADGCLRRGHAVVNHLRAAGSYHDRLVDRFSILDLFRDLRLGRHSGRDVLNSSASCVSDWLGPAVPRGRSCAEVLKVGSGGDAKNASDVEHGRAGLLAVLWGSIVAAVFAIIVATQMFAADVAQTFRIGRKGAVSGFDFSLSFLLLAIGHLVGLSVGIAMLIGAVIGWGWGVPHYSATLNDLTTAAGQLAQSTWSKKVRFVGAGAIGVSAIWTLLKLVKPVASGLASAMAASRARKAGKSDTLPITERDIPIGIVGLVTLVCMLPIGWILGLFRQ